MILNKLSIDKSWALFLDRDGVINKRIHGDYVKTIEEFEFLPGVLEAIALFSRLFGKIFVVTNQQGIGKKVMSERNLNEIHAYMLEEVQKQGGKIDAVYFAPHLASENSSMRKPQTGMGLKAKQDFPEIEFEKAIMIGDSDSDIVFGINLGMKTIKIGESNTSADLNAENLIEIAKQLKA